MDIWLNESWEIQRNEASSMSILSNAEQQANKTLKLGVLGKNITSRSHLWAWLTTAAHSPCNIITCIQRRQHAIFLVMFYLISKLYMMLTFHSFSLLIQWLSAHNFKWKGTQPGKTPLTDVPFWWFCGFRILDGLQIAHHHSANACYVPACSVLLPSAGKSGQVRTDGEEVFTALAGGEFSWMVRKWLPGLSPRAATQHGHGC